MAYVCLVPSISIGTSIFIEGNTCVDISNYNLSEYVYYEGFYLYVVVKWEPSSDKLHPHLKCYHNGHLFDTIEFDNECSYAYQDWFMPIGSYIFQFLGDYGEEPLMHISFDVVEELSEGDELLEPDPAIVEEIDYSIINDYTYNVGSHIMGNAAYYDMLSKARDNVTDEIIENEFNNLEKSLLEGNSNLLNGQSVIKFMINAIDIPDMATMSSDINGLTLAMNALKIPELHITNQMLSGLKESVDGLDVSGISALSGDIHDSEQTTVRETSNLSRRQSTFHNYTWNHLNNIHNGLTSSMQTGWTALGGAINNLSIPTVSEIVDGIGDITPKMPDLSIPTIDDIKESFISAAGSIADKILERVWDEIERRYEK